MNISELVKIFDEVWESYEEAYEIGCPTGESLLYEVGKVEFMMLELTNLLLNTEFTKEEIEAEREREREAEKEITCEKNFSDDGKQYLVIHRTLGNSEWFDKMKSWAEEFKRYAEEVKKVVDLDEIFEEIEVFNNKKESKSLSEDDFL